MTSASLPTIALIRGAFVSTIEGPIVLVGHSYGGAGRGNDKRDRLVAAARQTVHEQGVERTTLAMVAATADVPLGNIYYYFKTKDELLSAVVDAYNSDYQFKQLGR